MPASISELAVGGEEYGDTVDKGQALHRTGQKINALLAETTQTLIAAADERKARRTRKR